MSDHVIVDQEDSIATVTVNRPKKRNAMDIPSRKKLRSAFENVADDDEVRAVVLRGAGDGAFIAGGDLDSFSEFNHMEAMEYVTKHAQGLYNYVANLPKPTVAAGPRKVPAVPLSGASLQSGVPDRKRVGRDPTPTAGGWNRDGEGTGPDGSHREGR
jgi:hypothetical protein